MKYIAINPKPMASQDWEDQPPVAAATTVYEHENSTEATGLYDANGTPLYRVRDRIKLGYF